MTDWVNLSEYGRLRGCTSEAVKQAIVKGRLKNSVRQKENGKWEVNPTAANIEWELTTKHKHKPKYLEEKDTTELQQIVVQAGSEKVRLPIGNEEISRGDASLRLEIAKAAIEEIKLSKMREELIEVAVVKTEAFKLARGVRDSILNIPDRVAAEFAGMTVAHEIHMRLSEEIRKALEGLANADA